MPQIIVTTSTHQSPDGAVMLRERINLSDFESDHFTAHLLQRLRWAVGDSHAVEHAQSVQDDFASAVERDTPMSPTLSR